MSNGVLAWHFVGDTLRDGRPIPPDGEWLEHGGELSVCEAGLHASREILDALNYAPGSTICRVRCGGEIVEQSDRLVCSRRKILWRIEADELLRDFARRRAWSVITHWESPEIIVEFLRTGDESKLSAAWSAVDAAAWSADNAAARSAAWFAVSWNTSWNAAWFTVDAAATDAAARSAAADAAWSAATDAANKQLAEMVMEKHLGRYQKWTPESEDTDA